MVTSLMQTHFSLPGRRQGKVRDIYDATLDDGTPALLIVASDRISAFDVVMPNPITGKGVVLTQISRFWFDMIARKFNGTGGPTGSPLRMQHHLIATDAMRVKGLSDAEKKSIARRVMVGRRCRVVPVECVVRGYLAGSGWSEYQQSQSICGVKLPAGLKQCDKLSQPIFTPATKAESGHDENISFERACEMHGRELITRLRDLSIAIYVMARDFAATRGIIIADTKFEFGLPVDGGSSEPILIDEVLTPDSSRFWPADQYQPGRDQPSFDKQFVRNYLETLVKAGRWNKTPPGPVLPDEVVKGTLWRYLDAYRALTGGDLTL